MQNEYRKSGLNCISRRNLVTVQMLDNCLANQHHQACTLYKLFIKKILPMGFFKGTNAIHRKKGN